MTERIELKEINYKGDFLIIKEKNAPSPKVINESDNNLRNEYIGMLLVYISTFFQAFGSFWTKVVQRTYPKKSYNIT